MSRSLPTLGLDLRYYCGIVSVKELVTVKQDLRLSVCILVLYYMLVRLRRHSLPKHSTKEVYVRAFEFIAIAIELFFFLAPDGRCHLQSAVMWINECRRGLFDFVKCGNLMATIMLCLGKSSSLNLMLMSGFLLEAGKIPVQYEFGQKQPRTTGGTSVSLKLLCIRSCYLFWFYFIPL